MKSTTIVCSLFAALAGATATNDELAAMIPPCAQGCLAEGYKAFKCGPTDYQCQCVNEGAIFNMTDACLDSSCTTQDQKNKLAASTILLCGAVAQQMNPNWTGPAYADIMLPNILYRSVDTSAAVGQVVASMGFVGAAVAFALAL